MQARTKTEEELRRETIEQFWETIPGVWNQLRGNLRVIVTENYDVSVEQFHIMRHICRGVQSVSELAEARQISRPAISQAVELLVEKGLVSRHQETADRRFVTLKLTPSGEALINKVFAKNRKWMAEKMAGLSREELESISRGFGALKDAFLDSKK